MVHKMVHRMKKKMSRIQLTDNVRDMLIKMSDGNPDAIVAMMDIIALSTHNQHSAK